MRTKNINPYRTTCQFVDERQKKVIGKSLYLKGYSDNIGYFVGPVIIYNTNGTLCLIGSFDNKRNASPTRKIGHWKEYGYNGALSKEEIYIK